MTGPRLAIIPAGAVTDPRLEGRDLQVLCLLGRHTDDAGWCRRSQVVMAQEIRCARSTVQASLARLEEAGWVEHRVETRHDRGHAAHSYRVVLDPEDRVEGDGAATPPSDLSAPPCRPVGTPADLSAPPCRPVGTPADLSAPLPIHASAPPADPCVGTPSSPSPYSPPSPSPTNDPCLTIRERETRADERELDVSAFEAAWPSAAADDRARTAAAWRALTPEDRRAAIAGIPAVLAVVKASGRSATPSGWVYLEQRRWTLVAAGEPAKPGDAPARPPVGEMLAVSRFSREWWGLVFEQVERKRRGRPVHGYARMTLRQARGNGPWTCSSNDMPTAERLGLLQPFPAGGPAAEAWCRWLDRECSDERVRLRIADDLPPNLGWLYLPGPTPPPGRESVWGRGDDPPPRRRESGVDEQALQELEG